MLYGRRTVFPVAQSQTDTTRSDEVNHNPETYSQYLVSQLVLSPTASSDDWGSIP